MTAPLYALGRFCSRHRWATIVLSFVVPLLAFRSLLVPIKAAAMNLISVAAAYGVVTAVFQWGWASEHYKAHGDPPRATVEGLVNTGRVIASAAAISVEGEDFFAQRDAALAVDGPKSDDIRRF